MANQDMLFPVLPKPMAPIHPHEHQQQQNRVLQVEDKPKLAHVKDDDPALQQDQHHQHAQHSPPEPETVATDEPVETEDDSGEKTHHHIDIRV